VDAGDRVRSNGATARGLHLAGALVKRVVAVLMIVGASLNGSRSGDTQARAMYERRNRDYRP
jgi:hypothetical protein